MSKLISCILIFLAPFSLLAQMNWKIINSDAEKEAISKNLSAVPGQYIIKLRDSALMPTFNKLNILMNAQELNVSHGNYQLVSFMAQLTESTISDLRNHPSVEYIEPNYIYYIQPENKEDFYRSKSFVKNTKLKRNFAPIRDTLYKEQWGHPYVKADKIWSTHNGSNDIIVAIIDTGIFYNHEDLKDNIWVNQIEKDGIDGVDDDGNGFIDDFHGWDFGYGDNDPRDGNGHGTHCAGTVGALHNDKGIRGINKNIKLMALQFGYVNGGATVEKAIKSIDYAVNNGARILSNSWGGFPYSEALKDSIKNARDKGVLFVTASGNNKRDIDNKKFYPASYELDNIFVVSAINQKGEMASFSNWGKNTVHLFAPGRNILSTVNKTNWRPKWYRKTSGTSMAAPYVTGAAALLLSAKPYYDYKDLTSALMQSAAKSPKTKGLSKGGLLDIEALMKL